MKLFRHSWIAIAASTLVPFISHAQDVSLTIYSNNQPGAVSPDQYRPIAGQGRIYLGAGVPGYAMVRHTTPFVLKEGTSHIAFDGVAALLDPTTVTFKSLTDPTGTRVVSQNYLFDLVNNEALLERYLGKDISVEQSDGGKVITHTGQLLSTTNGTAILKTKDGIFSTNNITNISFPQLPEGLRAKPTLQWDIYSPKGGTHNSIVSYQTQGITWWTDYNVTLNETKSADTVDITPWVSILNQTGTTFNQAEIKLMAGEINRQQPQPAPFMKAMAMREVAVDAAVAPPAGFAEKSFFEYHLYTLGHPETIPNNSTKQIALFNPVMNIPAKREYVFSSEGDQKVGVFLKIINSEKNGLGKPLPAGRIRISKQDGKGFELIGEDTIKHTPRDEEVKLKLGNAFDIVAERKVMNAREDSAKKHRDEDIIVEIKNRKKENVTVLVDEIRYGSNIEFIKPSHSFKNKGNGIYEFSVPVSAGSSTKLSFTVRSSWN